MTRTESDSRPIGDKEIKRGDPLSPIERWAQAPAEIIAYKGGRVTPPNGESYTYHRGRRLIIDGKTVMDTSESPWARATVNAAIQSEPIRKLNPSYPLRVLERGAGLNIVGNRILEVFQGRGEGGEYTVIELNHEIAERTRAWANRRTAELREAAHEQGIDQKIKITVIEGDAREVSRRLIIQEAQKFNIIISDTYPLTPDEEGINDIADIDVLKQGLYRNAGVFGFFAYFPEGPTQSLSHEQFSLLAPQFENVNFSGVDIRPAQGYDYLFGPDGNPIRRLPVVICTDAKN